jgi:hypothetical protein
MAKPKKPQDIMVANGWYLNIPFPGIGSDGLFETLTGVQKQSGTVEVVDAGTNKKYKFTDQLIDFGEMTLTRSYQANATDRAMELLVSTMVATGLKLPVTAIKMHQGREVFTVVFEGFAFHSVTMPNFDTASSEKFTATYTASCDDWAIVPVAL